MPKLTRLECYACNEHGLLVVCMFDVINRIRMYVNLFATRAQDDNGIYKVEHGPIEQRSNDMAPHTNNLDKIMVYNKNPPNIRFKH